MTHTEIEEFRKRVDKIETRLGQIEHLLAGKKNGDSHRLSETSSGVKALAEKLKVSVEKIYEVFDVETDKLTLLTVLGNDETERTQNGTLMVLLGYKYLFNNNEDVLAQEVRRNLAENKIALNNFATHLKGVIPSFVRRKGKTCSNKAVYRLTVPGEVRARDLLSALIGAKNG